MKDEMNFHKVNNLIARIQSISECLSEEEDEDRFQMVADALESIKELRQEYERIGGKNE